MILTVDDFRSTDLRHTWGIMVSRTHCAQCEAFAKDQRYKPEIAQSQLCSWTALHVVSHKRVLHHTVTPHHRSVLTLRSRRVSGLWSWYTKPPTLTPQFLNLRHWLRFLHKSSVCINNGKPTKMAKGITRHFITTTWIIRLLFRPITYIFK
jgi:hypothetical protein